MATATENKVLSVLANELEKIPVRGIQPAGLRDRRTLVKIVAAMRQMSNTIAFESGRYRSLDDIMATVNFHKPKQEKAVGPDRPGKMKRLTLRQLARRVERQAGKK